MWGMQDKPAGFFPISREDSQKDASVVPSVLPVSSTPPFLQSFFHGTWAAGMSSGRNPEDDGDTLGLSLGKHRLLSPPPYPTPLTLRWKCTRNV